MELIRVCTSTAPGLRIWLNALRKDLIRLGHRVEIIDNGAVHGALRASHPNIVGLLCLDATLQPDREQGGLELLTRLQWHGEPGTDETLQQFRDQVSALVSSIPGLSLRNNSPKPALDSI
ncbi:hypothetical protein [Synechococcus sp. Cruz CV12-2-Slac-r]|uniref:hypothetical protein n=1 Tax=Synechococcus sp. Cruz CV12-2-Slac-r TaxID=2823748 RepID=UPI0020CF5BEE|nr:hypothetical protein [Synechococcus sp. Cruz CV12-2-Slac-r]MCP9939709.1 hypothetical protein [Synechococcus sp. Cruz CV12-2-Slac-r]MDA0291380.1 hypothetical protein [Cyanobacteriota bacterium]MDA1170615.1 hypothetical protein [Cyanobacteriota bacterium]